jgi:hypothetical protein
MVRDVYPCIQMQKHYKYSPGISKLSAYYAIILFISYSWHQKKKKKKKKNKVEKFKKKVSKKKKKINEK